MPSTLLSSRCLPTVAGMLLLGFASGSSQAQITQTVGAGSAISGTPARVATFDNVRSGTDLTAYTENNLSITVPTTAYGGFDPTGGSGLGGFSGGFFYPTGGAFAAAVIKTTDNQKIYGLEFNVGSGFSGPTTHFAYFVFNGGSQIATGNFDVTGGSVLGFSAPTGFDQIDIGAYSSSALAASATPTSYQAIAIDNVKVSLAPAATVTPEPGSVALLMGMSMTGAGLLARRRKQARNAA